MRETLKEIPKFSLSALFAVFCFVCSVHAQNDQSGFISIDCGLPESEGSYSEPTTGINYVSDEPFINTGVSKKMPLLSQSGYQKQLAHLRAFPEGTRNCYTVDVLKGTSYLIRAVFYYGNYDGKNNLPSFDLHVGSNFWESIVFYFDVPVRKEIIHVPSQDFVRICLANNGTGTPFISALELRPMSNSTYVTQSGSLALDSRVDLGSITNQSYRYPEDTLDRTWSYFDINNYKPNWTTISTSSPIDPGLNYKVPSRILSTAITPKNPTDPLIYSWFAFSGLTTPYYMYLYFSEVEKLQANESRSFDIFVNGKRQYGPVVPSYSSLFTVYSTSPLEMITDSFGKYTVSLVKSENSTLPPILNAIEIYTLLDLSQRETEKNDVEAITMVKLTYGLKRNWDGDPCAPIKYLWTGLNCSYAGSDPPRITALNLSSSGLTGEISPYIFNLSMLESLDLSNNAFTGPIPQYLAHLPNLRFLNLKTNNFNGSIPAELIAKSKSGNLELRFDDSTGGKEISFQCTSSQCEGKKKKSNILIPILASVGGVVFLLVAAITILMVLKRKKKQGVAPKAFVEIAESEIQSSLFETRQRQFTYSEVVNITNNFENILGRGGFGTVYYGTIGNVKVAIKKLSESTVQGYQQFQAEIKLLMTVHHRNLTSLVGYCMEGSNMALIYEYMTNGDLDSHLSGRGNVNVLHWEKRLEIALDSAQGLEYLHNGCKPPIIHRDVKTTNILLSENFQAKLADFGLSRSFPMEGGTHVFTGVAGTPGYLDPEYSSTNKLTEKSDVYSFGVVLLQLITGRSAILSRGRDRTHIGQWVGSVLSNGDIEAVVDQRLRGDFDNNSAWKAVEIAMVCVSQKSSRRPNMSQVVSELKVCLEAALAQRNFTGTTHSTNSSNEVFSMRMESEFGPGAR